MIFPISLSTYTSLNFAKNYSSLLFHGEHFHRTDTNCMYWKWRKKQTPSNQTDAPEIAICYVSHSLSGMCAVAWLVYVGENLIKLQNSISCLFYDDHILHETRFKHIQLSVFMFINKHLWQEFNISNIVAHVLQANCNQKLITSLQW